MKTRLALAALLCTPMLAMSAPETYPLDPTHTYPSFHVEHWGLSMMHGRFDKMTGKFVIDRAAKTGSAELSIDAASLTTGDNVKGNRPQSRDDHLKSADFFNTKEFPTMTFKSTKVTFSGDLPSAVEGNLTLLGVTKPLKLTATHFNCGPNPFTKKEMCGADLVGTLKRTDFGMKYGVPAISDEVKLTIAVEGYRD